MPGTWFQLGIIRVETGDLIGDCGLHFLADDPNQVELGITLAPGNQSRGLAQETLACVLEYLFEIAGKHRVFAMTDAENVSAEKLFTRLGFRKEGHFVDYVWFKGAYGSEYSFALLQREWKAADRTLQLMPADGATSELWRWVCMERS